MTDNLANKISDLRRLAEERRNTNDAILGISSMEQKIEPPRTLAALKSTKSFTPNRRTPQATAMTERPASRMEITSLEHELEERVRLVLDMSNYTKKTDAEYSEGYTFEPHREAMMVVRERMLAEFGVDPNSLHNEPWLDSFIKCECLKVMCDDVSSRFADMLAVHSVELGSVLRKLRLTYKQSFEQMHSSWKTLRMSFLDHNKDLSLSREVIKKLQSDLDNKENEMHRKFDNEINRLNEEFNAEKARDQEKLLQTEFKMEQMSDTLKYLNGIFRTMQSDGATIKTADLQAKCYRLEKENFALQEQNAALENVNAALAKAEQRVKQLEKENKQCNDEIRSLKNQLDRREEVVKQLMEKETLRNAEIEKLQKMSKLKDDELVAVDLKDSATSVLCIKCKKSLDDLSNIRSAILGDQSAAGKVAKMQCEAFRILLPNLKGRQPNRTSKWLRCCMRSILMTKMKEDVHLHFIKGQSTRFPAFVYTWFVRKAEGRSSGAQLAKLLAAADEDRWGLYYGVRALSKDDPEALVFWSLLDETYGEDGLQYILYCLSVLLSIGGAALWKQFGSAMEHGSNINVKPADDRAVVDNIWVDIFTAKEAVKLILVRALAAHVTDAMDAIDALKVRPTDAELDAMCEAMREERKLPEESTAEAETSTVASTAPAPTAPETVGRDEAFEASNRNSSLTSGAEPTHINLFMWLRLMLQQIHADQIQRSAAVRLMFETASVGALTPQVPSGGSSSTSSGDAASNGGLGAAGTHVEYPQFQSICTTLFPHVPITETCVLYANCYDVGQRKVNADTFVKVADRQGLFAHALKLPLLPLLKQPSGAVVNATASVQNFTLTEPSTTGTKTDTGAGDPQGPVGFSLRTEQAVRSKLATMVHRKLAAVTPSITSMLQSLPERWHAVVEDAIEAVKVSLADSHQKLKQQVNEQISHSYAHTPGYDRVTLDEAQSTRTYIDGLQPFIAYRRLLLLGSLVKTLCDNPLLPSELFSASDLDNNALNIDHAMFRAEKLLTSIEQAFLLAPAGASGKGNTFLGLMDKYHSFETVRTRLVARRLQQVFRKFLNRDLVVPRSVRLCMTPGYLGYTSFATAVVEAPLPKYPTRTASTIAAAALVSSKTPTVTTVVPTKTVTYEKLYLRNREVYHEPWWGQALVAETYRYKLTYDAKAASLGLNPIPLAQAVTAAQYYLWGTMELAETVVHDIFLCVRAYRLGVPRLRLFAAFLGDGWDLDEPVAEMLATPHALSVYFSLLTEVHRELYREQHENLRSQNARGVRAKEASELSGIVETAPEVTEHLDSAASAASFHPGNVVNILFPSTENALKRADKKDVWNCSMRSLVNVAKRWSQNQRALAGTASIYAELPEKLRANLLDQIEVDDFLWIMMIQWAKLAAWHVRRSTKMTSQIERTYLTSKYDLQKGKSAKKVKAQLAAAVKGGSYGRHRILTQKATYQELPLLPMSSLRAVVESAYHPGEGRQLSDTQHYVSEFIRRVGLHKNTLKLLGGTAGGMSVAGATGTGTATAAAATAVGMMGGRLNSTSRFTQEMEKVLHECVLWDTNSLDDGYMRCMQLVHRGSLSDGSTPAQTASPSNIDRSAAAGAEPHSLPSDGPMAVLLGYNPELTFALVKSAFIAYQTAIKQFMEDLVFHLEEIASPDLDAKYNAAAGLVQALGELFYPLEYSSYRVYAHEADCTSTRALDPDVRSSIEHTLQVLSPVQHLEALEELQRSVVDAQEVWQKWQSLVSLLAEMAIATNTEMPHDSWNRGTKTHVDRATVYSVTTKNAP